MRAMRSDCISIQGDPNDRPTTGSQIENGLCLGRDNVPQTHAALPCEFT